MAQPHFIVFANEKGGTGKSTTAVHTAVALAAAGPQRRRARPRHPPADHDPLSREPRRHHAAARHDLPQARYEVFEDPTHEALDARSSALADDVDVIVIDTPGRDDPIARAAMLSADTLVTPMNDSFVDLDLIGQVDPENYKVTRRASMPS